MADRVPSAPGRWPFAGHVVPFLRDALGLLDECARDGRGAVRLDLPGPALLLRDVEDVQYVLQTRSDRYIKGPRLTSPASQRVTGYGVLTTVGEEHLARKRALQPAFSARAVEAYAGTIVSVARSVVTRWPAGRPFDAAAVMMSLTETIVGRIMFGDEYEAHASRLQRAIRARRRYFAYWYLYPIPFRSYLPLPVVFRNARAVRVIRDIFEPLIARRREAAPADLAGRIVHAQLPDGRRLSPGEAFDELRTLAVTGFETIGETLAWTLYLVNRHPEVEARVLAEVDAVLGDRDAGTADVERLRYLRQVISESMRLYPATWLFTRQALGGDRLPSGAPVAAGTKLFVSPWVLHRSPRYYPDPSRFDPDRFAGEERSWPAFAYIPFGGGLRVCIGQALAKMEIALVLATIYQTWRLSLVPGQRIVPHPGITLTPKYGIRMVAERRQPTMRTSV